MLGFVADPPCQSAAVLLVTGYKRRFPHLSNQQLAQAARRGTSFELGRFAEADLSGSKAIAADFGIGLKMNRPALQ
jgi:hypothetical protein